MLVRVAGQRSQRFEFAHCLEPAANCGTELLLPSLGGEDELRATEK